MSFTLRANRKIKRLFLYNVTMIIPQMAYESDLFLQDVDSVKHTLGILHHFYQCRFKVKQTKTEVFFN